MTSEVSNEDRVDGGRRHFLLVATTVTGIAGAAMTAVPFLASWKPSARAQALGAPVEQDISKLEPGAMVKVNWRGQAIFIVRRSPEMMKQHMEMMDMQMQMMREYFAHRECTAILIDDRQEGDPRAQTLAQRAAFYLTIIAIAAGVLTLIGDIEC